MPARVLLENPAGYDPRGAAPAVRDAAQHCAPAVAAIVVKPKSGRGERPPARPGKVTRKKSGPTPPRSAFDVLYQKIPGLALDELDGFDGVIEWPV